MIQKSRNRWKVIFQRRHFMFDTEEEAIAYLEVLKVEGLPQR